MKQNDDKIAIYSRKSKFTGKGESIGNQIELCKEYVRTTLGPDYVDKCVVFEDEGFSGGDMKRPGFKRMMSDVRNHKFSAIVVYRLDRIGRNISDFAGLMKELKKLGVSFVSIKEQFDTVTPMGRAMMYIISVFSQLERETIAERIRDNMHELAKTGRWLGGNTPTGYESESASNMTIDNKVRKTYHLKLIPQEAEIVKTIFELYTQTDSLTAVEAELMRRRIRSKNGKDFSRFSIKGILQNPVYLIADEDAHQYFEENKVCMSSERSAFDGVRGIMAYNRTDQEKGRATIYLPMTEWIVAVGKHHGLIPAKQWIAVQRSLERNKSKGYRKPRNNQALMTGLLFCACGERMYPKQTTRRTESGDLVYSYMCKMKERSKGERCKRKNVKGNLLDSAIIEQVKLLAEDAHTFITQMEKSKKFYTGNREAYESQLADLRGEFAANEKIIKGLIDSLGLLGAFSEKERVAKRIEELAEANREIEKRINELEGLTSEHRLSEDEFDFLRQMLATFASSIDSMTVEEKRVAIRTVIRKAIWDGENAHVVFFGAEEGAIEYPEVVEPEDGQASGENDAEDEVSSDVSKVLLGEDSK